MATRRGRKGVANGTNNYVNGSPSRKAEEGVTLSQAAPVLLDLYPVLMMVLGGCCANVWAYEQLLIMNPRIGSALTFSQMLFITILSLPKFLSFDTKWPFLPRLKARQVPLHQWAMQVLVLTTGSLLNNWAFAYNVPLTILIVFRSAGLAVSMLFGVLFLKKRYNAVQVISVTLVSIGVVLATLSRPAPISSSLKANQPKTAEDMRKYMIGIAMIVTSLFFTGFLGLLQEKTYKTYGPCWQEGVFYTHLLSLPAFMFLIPDVKQGLVSLSGATSTSTIASYIILGGNLVSQLICVSGVNRLTSQVSSVSTNLVLTTRKALSLCLSVWWFKNGWNSQLVIGAGMVFFGSFLFTTGERTDKKNVKKE